jgi:predicted NBD/HSP70 family sugar kinase
MTLTGEGVRGLKARLRQSNSTAIDVPALLQALDTDREGLDRPLAALADAIRGVVTTFVALADPQFVVVGGTWGTHPVIVRAVSQQSIRWPRHVPVRAARVATDPPLAGPASARCRTSRRASCPASSEPWRCRPKPLERLVVYRADETAQPVAVVGDEPRRQVDGVQFPAGAGPRQGATRVSPWGERPRTPRPSRRDQLMARHSWTGGPGRGGPASRPT